MTDGNWYKGDDGKWRWDGPNNLRWPVPGSSPAEFVWDSTMEEISREIDEALAPATEKDMTGWQPSPVACCLSAMIGDKCRCGGK